MLTIGEFSRICFVTKKTLRHYDEIGLLRPEHTAENGYRYYTVTQLRTMMLINRLKNYGFSLPEISAVLAASNERMLAEKLREKQRVLRQQAQDISRILRQMEEDADKLDRRMDIMNLNIVVKEIEQPAQTVFGVRRHIDVKEFQELFAQLYAEIEKNKIQPLGPPMAFYHQEAFDQENSDIELAVQVAPGTPGSRMVPGGPFAVTTLVGPYQAEAFTAAYAGLMKWTEECGYNLAGAPFDKYVRGGPDCPPQEQVTEIYFPLAK